MVDAARPDWADTMAIEIVDRLPLADHAFSRKVIAGHLRIAETRGYDRGLAKASEIIGLPLVFSS